MQGRPRSVEFKILGSPQVMVDGRPLGVGGPRTRAVLAMLAVNAGKIVAADVLQEELWPGLPARRAAANLQVRMSELRAVLRAAGPAVAGVSVFMRSWWGWRASPGIGSRYGPDYGFRGCHYGGPCPDSGAGG